MLTRSSLAIRLSRLKAFTQPDVRNEQYMTDSEVAADVLWHAYMKGDIEGKTIADLGAGTGVLGIGSLLLGAKKVFFVESDSAAVNTLKENLKEFSGYEILEQDALTFQRKVDTVIQNPPFGTRKDHADLSFLERAMGIAGKIYSLHKTTTIGYLEGICEKRGFAVTERMDFSFPLKKTLPHHKKKMQRIEVTALELSKKI